jgi:hypothetical protein
MRLWSQARLMGCQAAAAMSGALETELQPFSFELVRVWSCCTLYNCNMAAFPILGPQAAALFKQGCCMHVGLP